MREYIDLAYEKLGLSPEGHEIGTTRFIDLPNDVFYSICARRFNHVQQRLFERRNEPGIAELTRTYRFLMYKDFIEEVKKTKKYPANFLGWKRYFCDVSPVFRDKVLLKPLPIRLPADKLLNAYIVASSQSGKTELLKLFAHSVIRRGEEALIFIEPAGDAARQIALWPECKDRLIYVDLSLDLARAPTINPFQIYGIKAEDTSPSALDVKTVVAQQLMTAFQEVLGTGAGAELSKNMQTIIEYCLPVLLDYPGATLRDLLRFMDDKLNADLVSFGQSLRYYPDVVEFFTHSFRMKHFAVTKDAIHSKLAGLFASGKFARLTCGPSTFMLEKAIEERKIIVFNLAKGSVGAKEASAFGRLLVALLQGIAVRRDNQNKRVPTRVFIDEMHNFTTQSMETIITEAAKYKLYLMLAQQQIGQGTSKEIRDAILNVSVLIAGRHQPTFHGPVASMLNVSPEDIGSLDRGDFIAHLSGSPPLAFHIHKHLLGSLHRMSEREWGQVKADQLRRYYRPIEAPVPVPEIIQPSKVVPYRPREAPRQEPPAARRRVKAEKVEITEEEDII